MDKIKTLLFNLADQSALTRRFSVRLLARRYVALGADPRIAEEVIDRAAEQPLRESSRTLSWAASLSHGAQMPRGFRPDRSLTTNLAREVGLESLTSRLERKPNIQLERQRIYLDDTIDLDDAREFVRQTLGQRLATAATSGGEKAVLGSRQGFAVLAAVTDRLTEAGMRPFLVSGTLLGVEREGDLLEHDYDIDLGVLPEDGTAEDVIAAVSDLEGFSIRNDPGRVFLHHRSGVDVDVFMHYERDGLLWHRTAIHEWWNTPFELVELPMRGKSFFVPADRQLYLTENYGDWTRPIAFYHMSFDTPNRRYVAVKASVLYLYEIANSALERNDRFVVESAIRELRDNFDIDLTHHLNASPLLSR